MAINQIQLGAAAGDGNGDGLREGGEIINANFTAPENAASKLVQASSADTTSDKVMLTDHAWRGAQLGDYFTYGGTANAITLTSANLRAGGTLIAGMKFRFKATAANTGATTIAVDGGSTISCLTPTGAALPADFIRTDVFTECEYDGANFVVSRKVESGSNADGNWTKLEDGSLTTEFNYIAPTTSITDAIGALYSSASIPVDAPVAFVNSDFSASTDIQTPSGANATIMSSRITSKTSSTVNVRIYAGSSMPAATAITINLICSGRWY